MAAIDNRALKHFIANGTNAGANQVLAPAVTGMAAKTPVIVSVYVGATAECSVVIETNNGTPVTKAYLQLSGKGTTGGSNLHVEGTRGENLRADLTITGNWWIWGSYYYK